MRCFSTQTVDLEPWTLNRGPNAPNLSPSPMDGALALSQWPGMEENPGRFRRIGRARGGAQGPGSVATPVTGDPVGDTVQHKKINGLGCRLYIGTRFVLHLICVDVGEPRVWQSDPCEDQR